MTKKYKTLDQIRRDLDAGIDIYWCNVGYKVHYVNVDGQDLNPYSVKNGKAIRVSYIETYFGSLIQPSDIGSCFSIQVPKQKEKSCRKMIQS
jgi:hypothetical protein